MNKALGYISAGCKVLICVALFLICQMSALFLFELINIDYKVYEGSFITTYSLVIIIVFVIYTAICSYKTQPLLLVERLNKKQVITLIVVGFALLGIVSIYMIIANILSVVLTPIQDELEKYSESVDRFSVISVDDVPWWDPLVDAFATAFIVPLAEELVFRGAIFGELTKRFNWIISTVVSSVIFGLFHGISIHIGYALMSGFLLCTVYHYTKSIISSYIVHMVFNLFGSSIFILFDSSIMKNLGVNTEDLNLYLLCLEIVAILPAFVGIYYLYKTNKEERECAEGQL
ncbi:MAG: CPBP family intramembrane metalloprotease [Saccharofermentans sp.]|nr:CPBP family intramembrane metalloprotease [Saccharofermentans sp.]